MLSIPIALAGKRRSCIGFLGTKMRLAVKTCVRRGLCFGRLDGQVLCECGQEVGLGLETVDGLVVLDVAISERRIPEVTPSNGEVRESALDKCAAPEVDLRDGCAPKVATDENTVLKHYPTKRTPLEAHVCKGAMPKSRTVYLRVLNAIGCEEPASAPP